MTDTPLLNLILQKGPVPIENFTVNTFHFLLVDSQPQLDIFSSHVSKDDFCILIIVSGIDTSSHCGPCSNVDFVYFMWQHFKQFCFEKYAMTLISSDYISNSRLLFLKYFRAESDCWRDTAQCLTCRQEYKQTLRPITNCNTFADCSCNVCRRQPPSMQASATHVFFNLFSISNGLNWLATQHTFSMFMPSIQTVWIIGNYFLPNILPFISFSVSVVPITNSTTIVLVRGHGMGNSVMYFSLN
jgi:hypothetical protein